MSGPEFQAASRFLEQNFAFLFAVSALWVAAWVALFAWLRRRAGPMHPPFTDADVRFVENWVSGFSRKNLFTRFGGAHNALIVTVLKDAVLIEPMAIFKWLMPVNFNDLEHYVTKPSLTRVVPGSSFGRDTVRLEFRARDGVPRTIELVLRKRQEFLSALTSAGF